MRKRTRIILNTAGAVFIVAAATIGIGRAVYERRIDEEIDDLLAARTATSGDVIIEGDLAGLPEPVQRWLRSAGVVGTVRPTTVRLKQTGEIRLSDRRWFPYTAEQYYTTDPPGFVWKASVSIVPLVSLLGRDQYADGRGSIEFRLLGLVPLVEESGPDLDRGALLRYLNEIMWFPAAALSPYINWEPIDATSAQATMTWGGVSAPATFFFDESGRLTRMTAIRFDQEIGKDVPWSVPVSSYGVFEGVEVPIEGEASNARDDGEYTYIRVRITDIEYDQPERY